MPFLKFAAMLAYGLERRLFKPIQRKKSSRLSP
jgi:hypothetical protein